MEIIEETLNINNDVYGIIKVIVAISGFLALLIKTREALSDKRRKQNLKTDLEILEISKNLNSEKISQIRDRIESEIEYLYDTEKFYSNSLLNFILGLIISIGFSFWTISLFQNSEGFNAEALKLVELMPNWKPAKINGKLVNSYTVIAISFILR